MAKYANEVINKYLETTVDKLFALSLSGMFLFIVIGCAFTAGI